VTRNRHAAWRQQYNNAQTRKQTYRGVAVLKQNISAAQQASKASISYHHGRQHQTRQYRHRHNWRVTASGIRRASHKRFASHASHQVAHAYWLASRYRVSCVYQAARASHARGSLRARIAHSAVNASANGARNVSTQAAWQIIVLNISGISAHQTPRRHHRRISRVISSKYGW